MNDDFIIWDKNRKLSWDNFLGEIDPQINHAAQTKLQLSFFYDYDVNERKTRTRAIIKEPKLEVCFNKKESWIKKDDLTNEIQSQKLLNHEQGHFDLAYEFSLEAIKLLEDKFLNKRFSYSGNSEEEKEKKRKKFTKPFEKELLKKHHQLQLKYENETNHGKITVKQIEYDGRFAKLREN